MASIINAATSGGLISTADTSGILQLQTASTTAVTVDASQNVGIGTSSPSNKLEVKGGNGNQLILDNAGEAYTQMTFKSNGTNRAAIWSTASELGLYTYSTQSLIFYTNTTERARIDSSGNLGLGVTPSAWATLTGLQVKNGFIAGYLNRVYVGANNYYDGSNSRYIATDFATRYYQNAGQHIWETAASGTAGNAITFTQAMTLDASGNLGIGATSISGTRVLVAASDTGNTLGSSAASVHIMNTNGDVLGRVSEIVFDQGTQANKLAAISAIYSGFTSSTGGALAFSTNNGSGTFAERARIDSSGNLLVGKTASSDTTAGIELRPAGTTYFNRTSSINADTTLHVYSTGASAYRFYVGMGGTVNATSATISAISDQRFKENIQDLDVGLEKIMALKPRKFDWKTGKGKDIKNDRGFIAQEFETVFPDLIDEWKDPSPEGEEPYKSVRQDLIPVLVKAIQEQQALIQSLKARLDAANL